MQIVNGTFSTKTLDFYGGMGYNNCNLTKNSVF